jgi:anti-sigma B factor antagonist
MALRDKSEHALTVTEEISAIAAVLTVAGDIDMMTAPQLQMHVDAVLSRRPSALVIDLSHVEFLGSAGIGVLVQVHNNDRDMSFAVVARGPATSRPLHLLGLDNMFPIYPSAADAINGMGLAADEVG